MKPIQHILKQKMDRKQFLRTIGMMFLVVIGLSFLVKQPRATSVAHNTASPGNDTYGG